MEMEINNRKKSLVHSRCRGKVPNSIRKIRLDRQMTQTSILQSELEITHDEEPPISDSESSTSSGNSRRAVELVNWDGFARLQEGERGHEIIKNAFLSGMGRFGNQTKVVSIRKNSFSSLFGQAKTQTFRIYSEAMNKKCGGNSSVKFAWYGVSKDGVNRIIDHGFSQCGRPGDNGLYGSGVYLSPHRFSLDGAMSSPVDELGMRHVLLCRVILGNMEEVPLGSEQSCPSSKEFDCGVDNLISPRKYIVWGTHMNTHILPEYLISFKAPLCLNVIQEPATVTAGMPKSPWMPFPTLISVLSEFLTPSNLSLIEKHHADYQEKKISRQDLINHVRQIAGDKLLITVIKSFRGKVIRELCRHFRLKSGKKGIFGNNCRKASRHRYFR